MSQLYPSSPHQVPEDLATPTSQYKRQVAAAVIGVLFFFVFYFSLMGWFGYVAYRAFYPWQWARALAIGLPSTFLFLLMFKGLFAGKKLRRDMLVEITETEEPELFRFVHRIAAETGAPKPHKVYLSPEVNAAVSYDVGLLNLLLPTRKNLIIGLGLVNSLTLDEFKAVIAHEFGHFAQRSMGVGQWVYVAHIFVSDLVGRRDIFDEAIQGLSRTDFRIAWIGWLMRLLVWAVRAVVDQFFRFVLLLGRALSRQMEFQADLVSVSVAGSDSLVHALHRLGAADRGFGEAANFAIGDAERGKMNEDVYAIQTRFIDSYREVHALPTHGTTPLRPDRGAATHRVFQKGIADAPRMWSTHPSNKDREENCKSRYVPSTLDGRSAWSVFQDPQARRRQITRHFLDTVLHGDPKNPPPPSAQNPSPVSVDDGLERVDALFGRPALDRRHQGLYTTAEMTRALTDGAPLAREPEDFPDAATLVSRFDNLFEPTLADKVEAFFSLEEELMSLEGLRKGFLKASGGVIVHRGQQLDRKDVDEAADQVREEFEAHRQSLAERFSLARGLGLRIGRGLDGLRRSQGHDDSTSWETYLQSLHALLRYAEHTSASLFDEVTYFQHVLDIVFADGRVTDKEIRRLEDDGATVANKLHRVFRERTQVSMPPAVRHRVSKEGKSWEELIGPALHLTAPARRDFANDWIGIAGSWWGPYLAYLGSLKTHCLDVLLQAEASLMDALRDGSDPGPAPLAAQSPEPMTLYYGQERKRQDKLDWWSRFQVADGPIAGAARFLVAGALLAPAFLAGQFAAEVDLRVYNALSIPVTVSVNDETRTVFPGRFDEITTSDEVLIVARTNDGREIDRFIVPDLHSYDDPVYNVASAGAFVRWWAVYGTATERPDQFVGGRLLEGDASYIFQEPPNSISGRGSGGSRSVFSALGPEQVLEFYPQGAFDIAQVQVQWATPGSPEHTFWTSVLSGNAIGGDVKPN